VNDVELCYLLLAPTDEPPAGAVLPALAPRDAPEFFEVDIEVRAAEGLTLEVDGIDVAVTSEVFDGRVQVADCRFRLDDPFGHGAVERKRAVERRLREELLVRMNAVGSPWEQYSLVLMPTPSEGPDPLVERHGLELAWLLRTLPKRPDEVQVEEILRTRAHYSEQDLTLVDSTGAIIIAEGGHYESDIALCKIGAYQLLRYRLLDLAIEEHLRELRAELADPRGRWRPSRQRILADVIDQRLELLLQFEHTSQSLLFVGNWYSARVYWLIVQRRFLEDWRRLVSDKLASLEAIDATVRQSLTFSWRRVHDMITAIGWSVLMIGYFVLFYLNNIR
jgi:hypothetical protein